VRDAEASILGSQMIIYNLQGQKVHEAKIENNIDVSGLNPGVYYMVVLDERGNYVHKFIKA